MLLGLLVYHALEKRWLCPIRKAQSQMTTQSEQPAAIGWSSKVTTLVWIVSAAVLITFWTVWEQHAGAVALLIQKDVDRVLGGFEIPTTWFLALPSVFVLALWPLVNSWFNSAAGSRWKPQHKLIVGMLLAALCFCILAFALWLQSRPGASGQISGAWIAAAFVPLALAELLVPTTGFAIVSRLSPVQIGSAMMGVWFLNDALAGFMAGQLGAASYDVGMMVLMQVCVALCAFGALTLWAMRRVFDRALNQV
jgi:POT family proton-dependent oligopeptide transporter